MNFEIVHLGKSLNEEIYFCVKSSYKSEYNFRLFLLYSLPVPSASAFTSNVKSFLQHNDSVFERRERNKLLMWNL